MSEPTIRTHYINQLAAILKQRLNVKGFDELDETLKLQSDLRLDSVMLLQLLVCIEEELRLRVPEEEVNPQAFDTVGSLLDFMEALQPLESAPSAQS